MKQISAYMYTHVQYIHVQYVYTSIMYVHDVIGDVEGKKERKTPEAMEN